MPKTIFLALSFLASLLTSPAFALETEFRSEADFINVYRNIHQQGLSSVDTALDSYVVGNTQVRLSHEGFQLEVRPEIRGLLGRSVGLPLTDPAFATVRSPRRLLNLRTKLESGAGNEWYLDWERLNLSYRGEDFEVQAGRRIVSLGVLKVIPLMNKFSRPLPTAPNPQIIYASDMVSARWQSGEWALSSVGIADRRIADSVIWLEAIRYAEWAEVHLLASQWWRETTFGVAIAKDVAGATLRGELLAVSPFSDRPESQIQAGIGGEYAFDEKWSAVLETLYQSKGAKRRDQYTLALPSRFMPLRGFGYSILNAQYKLTPLWNLSAGALTNWLDGSTYALIKAQHSLNENTDLFLELAAPIGTEGAEFSARTFTISVPTAATVGSPLQASLGLRTTF
ncbi:MAG: hypothetical protein EOP11_06100 [Proteobacteria bacterium]|nr:MAG: hypothetical protein EOP11_06100 [Pseudomonadota bacterium]